MIQGKPKISVFTTCKNGGRYLRNTIDSILNQTFKDFEVVVVDSASTDNTIDILKSYSFDHRIRWISEPDRDANEGFHKAIHMTRGEYLMCMPVSDYFCSKTWFQRCVDILDNDIKISLVHGCAIHNDDNGRIFYPANIVTDIPSGEEFFPFWLASCYAFIEHTYCVRRKVFIECFPKYKFIRLDPEEISGTLTDEQFDYFGAFLKFVYNFNTRGYLSSFVPDIAALVRIHSDQISNKWPKIHRANAKKYTELIVQYRKSLLTGREKHIFYDGNDRKISTVNKGTLKNIKKKVLQYRIKSKIYFGNRDRINIYQNKYLIRLRRLLYEVQ